jgi:transcriptional regulator with XRE-family HTH domain
MGAITMTNEGRSVFLTQQQKKERLAERMGILMDIWESDNNTALTYPHVEKALSAKGIHLSRTRWSYLINGTGSLVTDQELLKGIAELVFNVPASYLCDLFSETPPEVEARMKFLVQMRKLKVKNFAARNLGAMSPETLKTITEIIDASMNSEE